MNIANEIIDRLTMREIFSRYGFEPDRKGNICCPFHNETQPSLGSYAGGENGGTASGAARVEVL